MTIVLLALAVVPPLLVLFYFIRKDKFREPTKYILATFFFGWAIIVPVLAIALVLQAVFAGIREPIAASFVSAFFGAGIPEELCKLMVLILYAMRRPAFDEAMDGIVYGVTVSLGFATFENIMYVLEHGYVTALLRAFTAIPMHAFAGCIMGFYVGMAWAIPHKRAKFLVLAFLVPMILHGSYDWPILYTELAEAVPGRNAEYAGLIALAVALVILAVEIIWARRLHKRLIRAQGRRDAATAVTP